MWSDCIDSHFKYVKARIIASNSSRIVVSILEANAWPPQAVDSNAFYLLLLGETTAKEFGTVTSRGIIHLVQWVWIITGDDLLQNQLGKNRGNRYRINSAMKSELMNGLYPGFCPKNTYTASQQGNQVQVQATPANEKIWWSAAKWMPTKFEDDSGVVYGAAQVFISEFSDVIIQ